MSATDMTRFASLYRSACADLALAESYQLPPATVEYLHGLVSKAHNQLYRTRQFQWRAWVKIVLVDTPKRIFNDSSVLLCTAIFWGLFLVAAFLSYDNQIWPGFAEAVAGADTLQEVESMYSNFNDRSPSENAVMAGHYIRHNASIGLTCFVMMLLIIPGMMTLSFNAVILGAIFGYMLRPEMGAAGMNFRNFVTAHGPFELTAIVLAAGAGLRIGLGWLNTQGLHRADSLMKAARESLPIAMTAVVLFCLAAIIEGFISPMTDRFLPWWIKGGIAWTSSAVLVFYFVVLGFPRDAASAHRAGDTS